MRDERSVVFVPFSVSLLKKDMKRLVIAAVFMAVVSCGLEEVGRRPHSGAEDIWVGPGVNAGKEDREKTVIHVTAMEYPEGYDWRADLEKGSVKCSLTVYADGLPMMKVPVGDEYEVSSDPDMHRMADGHLYTDYSTDSETVIKKDGKEIIRYQGREMICGLQVDGVDVYTLGHPREGEGFCYRKNGEPVIERTQGRSFADLYKDGTDICFAFYEPVASVSEPIYRYYHVCDGEVTQAAVREDVRKVWDMISVGGSISYLASVTGISSPVLFTSSSMTALNMPESASLLACNMLAEGGTIYVEGLFSGHDKSVTSGLWDMKGQSSLFEEGMTVSSICMNGDGICCMLNPTASHERGIIYRCGETFRMYAGYASMGSNTAVAVDGIMYAGLSSLSGGRPMIWKDGGVNYLDINGFISTVSVRRGQSSQDNVLD